jgi:hypothetical protein
MEEPMELRGLRVTTSTAVKEKRLAALLAGRDPASLGLPEAVAAAQAAGSLELAELQGPEALGALRAAQRAVAPDAAFTVGALAAWHRALGTSAGFRTSPRPDAPQSAPVPFIESRLVILEQWLSAESRQQLKPAQAGALVLARVMEILPFDEGNGRVARLAASHLMVQGGGRPPVLVGADKARLDDALAAAFQLHTEPLATLLDEASERVVDVMIRALE